MIVSETIPTKNILAGFPTSFIYYSAHKNLLLATFIVQRLPGCLIDNDFTNCPNHRDVHPHLADGKIVENWDDIGLQKDFEQFFPLESAQ